MAKKKHVKVFQLPKLKSMHLSGKSAEQIAKRLNVDVAVAQKHMDYYSGLDKLKPKTKKPKKIAPDKKPDNPGVDVTSGDA